MIDTHCLPHHKHVCVEAPAPEANKQNTLTCPAPIDVSLESYLTFKHADAYQQISKLYNLTKKLNSTTLFLE